MLKKDQLSQWKILVVDDHQDSLEVASMTLKLYGAQVYTARNGKQGLEVLEGLSPTLILLDISMPIMDGFEVLDRVRHSPQLADIPVVALTAHAMEGDRERIMNAGFDHYVSKPFRPLTFVDDLLETFNSNDKLVARITDQLTADA